MPKGEVLSISGVSRLVLRPSLPVCGSWFIALTKKAPVFWLPLKEKALKHHALSLQTAKFPPASAFTQISLLVLFSRGEKRGMDM